MNGGGAKVLSNIYLIVGPSGAGKSAITETLCERYGYKTVTSYTTRPKRAEDEVGHIFVTKAEFDALGEMCAYTKYNSYEYGVPASMVDECDLYVIDPAGVDYMREHYHGKKGIKVIGLRVDELTCRYRMVDRGDEPNKVFDRLFSDRKAFCNFSKKCDIMVNNGNGRFELACRKIHQYILTCENKGEVKPDER